MSNLDILKNGVVSVSLCDDNVNVLIQTTDQEIYIQIDSLSPMECIFLHNLLSGK